jgi:phytol kinase
MAAMDANAATPATGQKGQFIGLQLGVTLLALSFPWLWASRWPVIALLCAALAAASLLRAARRPDPRSANRLHLSRGEFWLGCGLCLVYLCGAAEPVAYCIAILVLAFADPAAAYVGQRYGRAQRMLSGARKSAAGSLAFFVTALVVVATGLAAGAGLQIGASLGAAALVATVCTAIEAALGDGLDNLFVPLAALAALEFAVF